MSIIIHKQYLTADECRLCLQAFDTHIAEQTKKLATAPKVLTDYREQLAVNINDGERLHQKLLAMLLESAKP